VGPAWIENRAGTRRFSNWTMMHKRKPAHFYVPIQYSPSILPAEQRDCGNYFLNQIHWGRINFRADANGFVRLKAAYLSDLIPADWLPNIREELIEHKVIKCDKSAIRGKQSWGYRLLPPYLKTCLVPCNDADLQARIWKRQAEVDRKLLPVHHWLRLKLDLVHFDAKRAESIIATLEPDQGSRLSVEEYRDQRLQYSRCLTDDSSHYLTCDKYGRVHTLLTKLEKPLRCCLSVNGNQLVNIDLVNSQPLIAGLVARRYYLGGMARSRLLDATFDGKGHPYAYRALDKPKTSDDIPNDVEEYVKECEKGTFYESFATIAAALRPGDRVRKCMSGWEYTVVAVNGNMVTMDGLCRETVHRDFIEPIAGFNRDRIKEQLYSHVFFGVNLVDSFDERLRIRFDGKAKAMRASKAAFLKQFKERYPSMAEMFVKLKARNHARAAWLLQNYESTMFIYKICGRIMRERRDMFVATIHDSILTLPKDAGYVEGVIMDEFKQVGVTPKLKKEICQ
jgi:hypothetical protein